MADYYRVSLMEGTEELTDFRKKQVKNQLKTLYSNILILD